RLHLLQLLFSPLRPPPSSTLFPYTTLFRSLQRRGIIVHAQVHTHAATARRGDERRERTTAVGTEQRSRRLDHQLEREGPRLEMEPRLEALDQAYEGGYFLGRRYLGQGDGEMCGELAAAPLHQRRHEPLERAGR